MLDSVSAIATWLQLKTSYTNGETYKPDIERITDDKRVSGHHAIIPTAEITKTDTSVLPTGEQDILNLVIVRLLTATAPKHIYTAVTATLDCAGHSFTAKGKTVIDSGWRAIEDKFRATLKNKPETDDDSGDSDYNALPELSEGQTFDSIAVIVKEGTTKPKPHLTEDSTLAAMETAGAEDMPDEAERKGLGTPATRAAILEKLIKSGLAERKKRNLLPTGKGKNLVAVLPTSLTSAKLTADWGTNSCRFSVANSPKPTL
jgi:DNA topoisomerase-3